MNEPKRLVTFALPEHLVDRARELGQTKGTTRNAMVLEAINEFIQRIWRHDEEEQGSLHSADACHHVEIGG